MTDTELFKYQRIGVRKIHKVFDGRALLADEMGLGKTIQVLKYAKDHVDPGPVVVVCPASIKWNWQREAAHHVGMRAEVLEGRTPDKSVIRRMKQDRTIWVVNYDILGTPYGPINTWCRVLKALKPKLIVLDEAHYLSNPQAKRSKNVRQLCAGVKKVIAVSGTPLTNRPAELWSVLNIVRPDIFTNFRRFAFRYCKPSWTPWGVKYTGAARLDELHELLKETCMVRRKKSQVLNQLPAKTRVITPVDLPNMKEYRKAEDEFVQWLRKTHNKVIGGRAAERLVQMGYLKRLAGQLKLPIVRNWIDDFLVESSGKLIVFTCHTAVVDDLVKKYGKQCVKVNGSVTGVHRQHAIDRFTTDKTCRVFVGNIQAAGVGWNGTVASTVLFAELDWKPATHTQAEDRVHRIGQLNPATIHYLIARDTLEEKLCKLLQSKQEVLDATMDGGKRDDTLDILDQLEAEMLKGTNGR